MDALFYLTSFAVLLIVGIIATIISEKIKIPNILILTLCGIIIGHIRYYGEPIVYFSPTFLTVAGILALAMIVFDSSSRFKLKEFDTFSFRAMKLAAIFLVINMIVMSAALYFILGIKNIFLVTVFSALMAGTAAEIVLTVTKLSKNRIIELLKIESILNTPLIVLIPFIILDLMRDYHVEDFFSKFMESFGPFLQQFVTGIGTGILIGIIFFKIMKTKYSEKLSPIALISAALLTYIIAENLKGNGVLAVTTLGLFFGNVYVREKDLLYEFSGIFANSLQIIIFLLLGIILHFPLELWFIMVSLLLFAIHLLVRYASIQLCFAGLNYSFKEKLFMALNVSKGTAVAVVVFILATYEIPEMAIILNLIIAFILYSIILSTVVTKFSSYFLGEDASD